DHHQQRVELVGRDHFVRQLLVQLFVGEEAARRAQLEQHLDARIRLLLRTRADERRILDRGDYSSSSVLHTVATVSRAISRGPEGGSFAGPRISALLPIPVTRRAMRREASLVETFPHPPCDLLRREQ